MPDIEVLDIKQASDRGWGPTQTLWQIRYRVNDGEKGGLNYVTHDLVIAKDELDAVRELHKLRAGEQDGSNS